jgi:hypothetical protein
MNISYAREAAWKAPQTGKKQEGNCSCSAQKRKPKSSQSGTDKLKTARCDRNVARMPAFHIVDSYFCCWDFW